MLNKRVKYILLFYALARLAVTAQTLVWSEEFNYTSAPDSRVWSYDLGSTGWGNSELQDYTSNANNVWVDGSNLVITARRSGNYFSSGRIKTLDKLTFQYGTVEARIQTPDLANGLWPAFWTMGNNNTSVGWPACGEIDIMEMGHADGISSGRVNRRVGSAAHWESGGSYAGYGLPKYLASDINDTFVIYRMEWTPYSIRTYIDGAEIWTMGITAGDMEEFHAPHFFLLNLAVGGTYPGITSPSGITAAFPAEYKVDWIRIYDNGYTVLGGSSTIVPPMPGSNALVNAGFESGKTGWTLNLSGGTAEASTTHARNGVHALMINSTGAGAWSAPNASQSFPANPGEVYNLQGYLLNPSSAPIAGSSFGLFKIEFRNSVGTVLEPAAVEVGTSAASPYYGAESRPFLAASSSADMWIFSWTQAEAPANTAWVSFILLNVNQPENPGPMYFDDIQAVLVDNQVQPFSLNYGLADGNIQIDFPAQIGIHYEVAYKSSLTNANWTPIETLIGNGKTNSFLYPMSDSVRFYRVSTP